MTDQLINNVRWNDQGLIPAIAQDSKSGKVLMLAWMNAESLRLTIDDGIAVYWSRSRNQLWRKGETSGHLQHIKEIRLDCDQDAILLSVEQTGGIACHTGRESCFYQALEDGEWQTTDPVIKPSDEIYGNE